MDEKRSKVNTEKAIYSVNDCYSLIAKTRKDE